MVARRVRESGAQWHRLRSNNAAREEIEPGPYEFLLVLRGPGFFEDRDTLLASLIERWRSKNTGNLIKQADCYAESISEAILNVFDCWVNVELFDSRFEVAVRGWAQQSVDVAREIKAADDARLAALQCMFLRFGYEPLPADVRARTLYLTQIGYISVKSKEDLKTRMNRMAGVGRVLLTDAGGEVQCERNIGVMIAA
jgi:hypothetical protein